MRAACLYTGINSGPNARKRVWNNFTFTFYRTVQLNNWCRNGCDACDVVQQFSMGAQQQHYQQQQQHQQQQQQLGGGVHQQMQQRLMRMIVKIIKANGLADGDFGSSLYIFISIV